MAIFTLLLVASFGQSSSGPEPELISPIAKYVIEKYDVNYLGREVMIDWAYVNPFIGYVYLDNLRISEAHKDTIFFFR